METFTVRETAAMLKLSEGTIRRFIADGRLKVIRNGRFIRISLGAIEDLLEPVVPKSDCSRRPPKNTKPRPTNVDESL